MLVNLKQAPDQSAASIGLAKYGRSVLPGTFQLFQPGLDASKRWITGIDEDSPQLRKTTPSDEYESVKEQIKQERESLESALGAKLDARSDFWENFIIRIKGNRILDLDIPIDRLEYRVLIANGYVAPNPDIMNSPEYSNVKFYISRTEEEESNKAKIKREKNKAISELTKIEENKNRLLIVSQFIFGNAISDDATMDTLYNLLSDYITEDKKGLQISKFNSTVAKTTEELQIKITVDEADRFKVIRQRDGLWQRGNITLGKSLSDVVKYLSNIENSNELASIIEAVREKRILG